MILVITERAQVEKHLKQIPRLESGIELLGVLHAAKKQARADKRHQGQGNFQNHQQAAQTVVVQPSAPPRPPVFKTSLMSVREALMAGMIPKTSPVSSEMTTVNPNTRASNERSIEPSSRKGGRKDHNTLRPQYATTNQPSRRAAKARCSPSKAAGPVAAAPRPSPRECSILSRV